MIDLALNDIVLGGRLGGEGRGGAYSYELVYFVEVGIRLFSYQLDLALDVFLSH